MMDIIWHIDNFDLPLPPPKGDMCFLSPFGGGRGRSGYCKKTVKKQIPIISVIDYYEIHQLRSG